MGRGREGRGVGKEECKDPYLCGSQLYTGRGRESEER